MYYIDIAYMNTAFVILIEVIFFHLKEPLVYAPSYNINRTFLELLLA